MTVVLEHKQEQTHGGENVLAPHNPSSPRSRHATHTLPRPLFNGRKISWEKCSHGIPIQDLKIRHTTFLEYFRYSIMIFLSIHLFNFVTQHHHFPKH